MNLETLLVLIETYWNVNVKPAGAKGEQGRCNTNILECKFRLRYEL